MNRGKKIQFSLGYNFDQNLITKVSELNSKYNNIGNINEFFAALPISPYPSARPNNKIKNISIHELELQIKIMQEHKIIFTYLFNGNYDLNKVDKKKLKDFLNVLFEIGINQLIVYSPELCNFIKKINHNFKITISSVFNVRTTKQIDKAYKAGADFISLDSIFLNRNFSLLRELKEHAMIPLKLYANLSCLSQCNKKDHHYKVISSIQDNLYQEKKIDEFFSYCSTEKLKNPVQWLQMQWIRPEDVKTYAKEGYTHFKLSDRLAPTENLILISKCYLKGKSPINLFPLMERNAIKYKKLSLNINKPPLFIDNSKIPNNFIDHFRIDGCTSTNIECPYCNQIAEKAIKKSI